MITHDGKKYRGISYRDGAFVFRYTDGQGREHRIRVQTLHEALKLYHEKRDMKRKGGMPAPVVLRRGKITFREIARDVLAYSDEHKRSARHDHWRMEKLLEWFGDKRADSITAREIEKNFEAQSWSPATRNRYRSLLSLTYRIAIRNGKLTDNPVRLVPHHPERNERVRFLSPSEEKTLRAAILERCPQRLGEFELALHTGLRRSEQYNAGWSDVNWEQRVLTIPLDKGGRVSHVPLNDGAVAALRALRLTTVPTGLICGGVAGPRGWFEDCLKAAGVTTFSWHCLRHTFASRLVMSGADVRTVAELLRHRTLAMVMRYAHLAPDFRMDAVQRMQKKFNVPRRTRSDRKSGTRSGTAASKSEALVH
ncbi:MAG: tyrosine-type recombinase/integrase [Vicinamibacterales bacterium]